MADIITRDVTLAYRLLRYVNSAYFGLPRTIRSIMDALPGVRNPLREVLDCVLAYMRADWEQFATQVTGLGPVPTEVPQRYREAIAWAQDILPATDRVN